MARALRTLANGGFGIGLSSSSDVATWRFPPALSPILACAYCTRPDEPWVISPASSPGARRQAFRPQVRPGSENWSLRAHRSCRQALVHRERGQRRRQSEGKSAEASPTGSTRQDIGGGEIGGTGLHRCPPPHPLQSPFFSSRTRVGDSAGGVFDKFRPFSLISPTHAPR